jgi:hypothetical protein
MDDTRWAKYAALGGVWFVVLVWVAGALAGTPPTMNASDADVAEYFTDNPDLVKGAAWLAGAATIGLVWWFGSVWRRLRAAEGGQTRMCVVALVGLTLAGAVHLVSEVINATLAMRHDKGGAEVAPFFWTMSSALVAMSFFGLVTFVAAVTALTFRTGAFPKWSAYIGWLAALLLLLGTLNVATSASIFLVLGLIGFTLMSIWVLVISWDLWKNPSAPAM